MDHLEASYEANIPEMSRNYPGLSEDVYKGLQHFLGLGNAYIYLQAYKDALTSGSNWVEAHSIAQQELDQTIQQQTKKAPPKNSTVLAYLNNLLK